MANGGMIGRRNVPGVDGYSGVWSRQEIADAVRKGLWDSYLFEVLADSPVALWRPVGSELRNVIGGPAGSPSMPAGVTAAPSIVPASSSAAIAMTGANAIPINAGTWAPYGNADRSVEVWFTTTASPATSDATSPGLMGYGASNTRNAFNLRPANTADASPADLAYKIWVWADDLVVTNSVDWNTGSRVHAVVTYNGTSRALKLYLNGAAVGSRTLGGNLTTPSGTTFYIGGAFTGVPWVGSLQEPAVYASEISAARIAAHYNAGIA